MPLPSGFAPSLDLGLSGPSQAISTGAPTVANGYSGSFTVGNGTATTTNSVPVTNTPNVPNQPGPFSAAGMFGGKEAFLALGLIVAAFFYTKKK